MPLKTVAVAPEAGESLEQHAQELYKPDGQPTTEGELLEAFLTEVDFDDMAADPDVGEFITQEQAFFREGKNGELTACNEGDDGAIECYVETIPGAAVANLIDEQDLYGLWAHFVNEEVKGDTLEDKLYLQKALPLVDEADLNEFKRGEFRKIRKQGAQGKNRVTRMLLAMLHKEAIKRVKKGSGYKKGDYAPAPSAPWKFYPRGSKPGNAKVIKFRAHNKGKEAGLQAKSGTKKVMKAAAASGGGKAAKKAAAKAALFGGGKGKQKIASSMRASDRPVLAEASLAGAALGLRGRRAPQGVLTEEQAAGKK